MISQVLTSLSDVSHLLSEEDQQMMKEVIKKYRLLLQSNDSQSGGEEGVKELKTLNEALLNKVSEIYSSSTTSEEEEESEVINENEKEINTKLRQILQIVIAKQKQPEVKVMSEEEELLMEAQFISEVFEESKQ